VDESKSLVRKLNTKKYVHLIKKVSSAEIDQDLKYNELHRYDEELKIIKEKYRPVDMTEIRKHALNSEILARERCAF